MASHHVMEVLSELSLVISHCGASFTMNHTPGVVGVRGQATGGATVVRNGTRRYRWTAIAARGGKRWSSCNNQGGAGVVEQVEETDGQVRSALKRSKASEATSMLQEATRASKEMAIEVFLREDRSCRKQQ